MMKCCKLTNVSSETAIAVTPARFLEPVELTGPEADAAMQAAAAWMVEYTMEWRCCAVSDNGIDDRRTYRNAPLPIAPECAVVQDGQIVGFFWKDHLFLISDPSTHHFSVRRELGYEGGWGDITEIDCYTLKPSDGSAV